MKLGNALKATNPFSGKETSLLDIGSIWSLILGTVLVFFVTATGQNLAKSITNRVPLLDTQLDPLVSKGTIVNNNIVY